MLAAARGFRARGLPLDAIVQDWQYWGALGWGPVWDPATYPDPAGLVSDLHGIDVHLMVSVWAKFDNQVCGSACPRETMNGRQNNSEANRPRLACSSSVPARSHRVRPRGGDPTKRPPPMHVFGRTLPPALRGAHA